MRFAVKLVLAWLSGLVIIPTVSANILPYQVEYAVQEFLFTLEGLLRPLFEALLGGYSSSEFLFAKVLLLILIFVVCQYALKQIPTLGSQKGVLFLVSAVVSILAVRYLQDNDLINGILLPYGVLGVAVATIIPFIIYFFALHRIGTVALWRRVAWLFFAIVFAVLWYSRYSELSSVSNKIYFGVMIAVVLAMVFDKALHSYFGLHEIFQFMQSSRNKKIVELQAEYHRILYLNTAAAKERKKEIEKQLKQEGAEIDS